MTEPAPGRSWWKRKRWIAVIVLCLVIAYPASFGPLAYLNLRGWLPGRYWLGLYLPLDYAVSGSGLGEPSGYYAYCRWWAELAKRHHAASD